MNYKTIKEERLKYQISQIKLAQYCGISPATISSWELEKNYPTEEQLVFVYKKLKELIFSIENDGYDIKKKTIQHSGNKKGTLPPKITSGQNYSKLMDTMKNDGSEYSRMLSDLYQSHKTNRFDEGLKAISLFSGCGGLDLGFSAAGFNIVGHIEIDPSAQKIYADNFTESELLGDDICKVTSSDVNSWKEKYGNIDLLIGGPPCQGFSLAGKRDPNDLRNKLYEYYVSIVSQIKPKVFIMENVRLLTSMKTTTGEYFINNIKTAFESVGYKLSVNEINSQDYGVPQSRERVIIVGIRQDVTDKTFNFPGATHFEKNAVCEGSLVEDYKKEWLTFRDATSDLKTLESGDISEDPLHWSITHPEHVINWLKNVPEGCSAHDNTNPNMRPPSGFNTTYKRIKWDEPCSTISTNFSMISGCRNVHPTSTRSLSIREAARAQSFPDEFAFFGKWGDVRKVIGNAVPPMLAFVIAKAIKEQLF